MYRDQFSYCNYGRYKQYETGDTPFNPIRSETLLVEPPTMISNRTRGIASLTTTCQCVLTLLLFSLWIVLYQLVSGATRFNLEAYGTAFPATALPTALTTQSNRRDCLTGLTR
jgi:hypothetical protein